MSVFRQIRTAEPDFDPPCIFDVGANVGQTVRQIRQVYPTTLVHAFEPVGPTYSRLASSLAGDGRAHAHRLALAARPGRALMRARPGATVNRIIDEASDSGGMPTEEVELITGDAFCDARGIAGIGILKIDTEGFDLDVLAGFHAMLAGRRIRYVEAECAISPRNTLHVPFQRIADFMFAFGYGLFRLIPGGAQPQGYANLQSRKWERGMWYGNAVFVAEPWPEDAVPI